MIHEVPARLVLALWPALKDYAERAMEFHPFMEAGCLRHLLETEFAQLFIATEEETVIGFAAMEVVKYPSRTVANCLAAGGKRGFLSVAVHELLPILQEWGREQGADTFALTGRPGWLRALRHLSGDSRSYTSWWVELSEQRRRHQQNYADHHALERGSAVHH